MATPKKRTPRRNGTKTREKLIDAAAETFNSVGYHGTDSNRIARAAGYAPGTFYKHFADKREIFLAAYERWVTEEWDSLRKEQGQRAVDRAALTRVTRLVLEHHRRWAGFRRSLRALAATDPVVEQFRIDQRAAQMTMVGDLFPGSDGKRRSPMQCFLALLLFERVCDAIADGEAEALHIGEVSLMRALRVQLRAL